VKSVVPVVIDSQFRSAGDSEPVCLLTIPLGGSSVLDELAAQLSKVSSAELLVMPSFNPPVGYEEMIRASTSATVRVVLPDQLGEVLVNLEIADSLLVVDPRFWPVKGHDFTGLLTHLEEYHGATHMIAVTAGSEEVRERIECDSTGSVRCIQRLYSAVEWPETAEKTIACTLAPARSVASIQFRTLSELRTGLLSRGGLNRDLPLDTAVLDLSGPQGLLALSDRTLEQMTVERWNARFAAHAEGVLVGAECEIHPSVRFVPPVVVHDRVHIGEGAMIIGPAVIGAHSRIGARATVAQCLVNHQTEIAARTAVRHDVCSGRRNGDGRTGRAPAHVLSLTSLPSESQWVEEMEVLAERSLNTNRRFHLAIKRVFDFVAALLGVIVLAVPMLVAAIVVRLTSAGPVFFAHRREGKGGKEFSCLKFRTMTADAHKMQRQLYRANEVDGPQFKLENDPRITRVGRLLRASNFDEIPQLFNVLAGHMSLVGPRPSPFRENQICVPWRRARLSVRPGITGLWQVCRDERRDKGDFHEWIYYDIDYVRRFSFWLDLRILVATVFALTGWRGVLGHLVPTGGRPRSSTMRTPRGEWMRGAGASPI